MTISPAKREFYAHSFADPAAQMFWDGGRLCCGTTGARAGLLRLLWEEGVIQGLSGLGLLAEVEAAGYDGYEFALRLRRRHTITYCYEWCAEMWKAAASHVIALLRVLAEFELTLQDPQPHYLLFDGARPVYVNPGSIAPLTPRSLRRAVELLSDSFIHPLALSQGGRAGVGRRLLRGAGGGARAADFPQLGRLSRAITGWLEKYPPREFLRRLHRLVAAMRVPDADNEWSGYYPSDDAPAAPGDDWSYKQREVYRVLTELRPRTVIDLGCNTGWYARLAEHAGARVVAADSDETCVNRLYRRARDRGEGIVPILLDVNDPSPGFGLAYGWFPPAVERLRSELVLGLAVSHHLVFSGMRLTLEQLARAFAPFAQRWLLVEFVPLDSDRMPYLPGDRPECADWYNLESFVSAFAEHFARVTVLPGPPRSRRLVLCEREDGR